MNTRPFSFVLYRSKAVSGVGRSGVVDILETARRVNDQLGLRGHLHYESGLFFQYLEGDDAPFATIWARIQGDARHSDVKVLSSGTTRALRFPEFRMSYSEEMGLFEHLAMNVGGDYLSVVLDFLERHKPQASGLPA